MTFQPQPKGRFTGRHMTFILVAFFGVVMAVNFTMARFATSGFSGTVVDNSYVASQKFNGWLAEAEAQEKLGWQISVSRNADGHILLSMLDAKGRALQAKAFGDAAHPLGQKDNFRLSFKAAGDGMLLSTKPIPAGRWQLYITIEHAGQIMRIKEDIA